MGALLPLDNGELRNSLNFVSLREISIFIEKVGNFSHFTRMSFHPTFRILPKWVGQIIPNPHHKTCVKPLRFCKKDIDIPIHNLNAKNNLPALSTGNSSSPASTSFYVNCDVHLCIIINSSNKAVYKKVNFESLLISCYRESETLNIRL